MKRLGSVIALLALAAVATAAPIRVGMFRGTGAGSGTYWHTNTHTASTVLANLLAAPANAGLGDSLIVPPVGFTYFATPVRPNFDSTAECSGNGCGPTPAQLETIVAALDTLDVLILNSNVQIGTRITDSSHRRVFETFWNTKGVVSLHETSHNRGSWPQLDSLHGAHQRTKIAAQPGTVRRDSVFSTEPAWRFLNRGVFSNGLDTTIIDEWMDFTTSGAAIRSHANLKPTVNLVEATINLSSATTMGDHPLSWYRELPTGGRFFYTSLGDRSQLWQSNRMFRRQLYNAILWAAGVDSNGVVAVRGAMEATTAGFSGAARISNQGRVLMVSVLQDGSHTVEVLGVDGRRVAVRRGAARSDHSFKNLNSGLHIVTVTTPQGRLSRRIIVP